MSTYAKTIAVLSALLFLVGTAALVFSAENEQTVSLSQVPPAVRATIEQQAAGAEIKKIELGDENGKQIYEVELLKGGQEQGFKVAADGTFLGSEEEEKAEQHEQQGEEKGKEESKQEIAYETLPDAVKSAAEQYLGTQGEFKAEKETEAGLVVYGVAVNKNGLEQSIEVTENGTVTEFEKQIPVSELPPALLSGIEKEYPNATVEKAKSVEKFSYAVELMENGKKKEIHLLSNEKIKGKHEKEEKGEEKDNEKNEQGETE
jgi:uncharacterized membrane protein YkoI